MYIFYWYSYYINFHFIVFVLHFRTEVNKIQLLMVYGQQKIKINIDHLVGVNRVKYSKFIFNRTVYNLHFNKKIRFYTRGEYAIELVDKDGLVYLIGSRKQNYIEF